MIKRINFFGGPGAGKSTTSAYVFQALKRDGVNVEYVPEYVKKWTYYHRKPTGYDQVYLFGKQMHNEDTALREFEHVVCDSPLMLAPYYAYANGKSAMVEPLITLAEHFEAKNPSINIFINRNNKKYDNKGRFQTAEQAKAIDADLKQFLFRNNLGYINFDYSYPEAIYSYIKGKLK